MRVCEQTLELQTYNNNSFLCVCYYDSSLGFYRLQQFIFFCEFNAEISGYILCYKESGLHDELYNNEVRHSVIDQAITVHVYF